MIKVCFTINDKFAEHCVTAIASIPQDTTREYEFIIIHYNLSEKSKKYFDRIKMIAPVKIRFIKINADRIKTFHIPTEGHFRHENYFRLEIPKLLPKEDKVIYLDSDLIVEKDLGCLWDISLEGYYIAACRTMREQENKKRLKLPASSKYINTGVMLMNLKRMREENISERCYRFIEEQPTLLKNLEQDALNVVLSRTPVGIKLLNQKWNAEVRTDIAIKPAYLPNLIEPYIIHFLTADKPWKDGSKQIYRDRYWKHYKRFFS